MADIRFAVKQLIDAGWTVIAIPHGTKKAIDHWNKKDYDVSDFESDSTVAVKCGEKSQDRVDVDCDTPEAVDAARALLPTTDMVHGRVGKPDSHYWYTSPGIKSESFYDLPVEEPDPKRPGQTKKVEYPIVEIRATGGYTVVPPSVWTDTKGDGHTEDVTWTRQRSAAQLTPEELRKAALTVAVAGLLARHWPGPGSRHAVAGPVAGFLHSTKQLPNMLILEIVRTVARITRSDEKDIVDFARGTLEKAEGGEAVTGGTRLAELLGDDLVGRLRTWFKVKDEDALARFNEVHFTVTMGSETVIGREDREDVLFQHDHALELEYANKTIFVLGEKKPLPLFGQWRIWKHRRHYRSVVFAPPPTLAHEQDYNLWRGYAVQPDETKSCDRFLEHLHEVICSANTEHFEYLMNLLALTVQEPGTPTGIATVMRGGQGSGKGLFVRTIGDLFGRKHYIQLDKVEQLAGKFNAALSSKIIVFADEAFFAGDKREVGALKRLITEPTLAIERKGIDVTSEDNHVHLFMATNERWSWPAAIDDRRGFLLKVSDARQGDDEYFERIIDELKRGGRAGLLAHLMARTVDPRLIRKTPKTTERLAQQLISLDPPLAWWYECLYEGRIGSVLTQGGWPKHLTVTALFAAYQEWLSQRRGRLFSTVEFGRMLGDYFSAKKSYPKKVNGQLIRVYDLRSLSDARNYWDSLTGVTEDWPSEEANLGPELF